MADTNTRNEVKTNFKLSVLICSITKRNISILLSKINDILPDWAEVIINIDNKRKSVGEKRNDLLKIAKGEYVTFVDDDDMISDDYFDKLLLAIDKEVDCICFRVLVNYDNQYKKLCYYSKQYYTNVDTPTGYYRLPNHIMCIKRELALQTRFPCISNGEDNIYAQNLKPLLKSEIILEDILYYYNFSSQNTATQ